MLAKCAIVTRREGRRCGMHGNLVRRREPSIRIGRNMHAPLLREAGSPVLHPAHGARAPWIERASWALYDFANTIFSMNIATLYFTVWLVSDLGVSNTIDAVANAIASILVVLSIPFLGALSDARRRRKPWVVGFTVLSCLALAALGYLGQTLLPLTGEAVD